MSSGYQPRPTASVPTGMHQVIPNRGPSIAAVRQGFEATFGGYVPEDWTLDAECTQPGTDPEGFYPAKGGGASLSKKKALELCGRCVVRQKCLDDELAFEMGDIGSEDVRPEVHGVRGGMVEKERRKLVQKLRVERLAKVRSAVVADYAEGSLTVEDIATKHKVTGNTVSRWAAEAGLAPRPRARGLRGVPSTREGAS